MNRQRSRARLESVLRAARRIQDLADDLGQEARKRLPDVTGLTRETIALALADHFETHPTDAEIETLLTTISTAPVCHVIMSANVFTAPLRALVLAVATSERVFVRPSRRDPVLTELLVRTLREDAAFAAAGGDVQIVEMVCPEPGHELHVYGSDDTIASITATLPSGVVLRAHGTGIGIAVIHEGLDVAPLAERLSRDISVFDQRGCLSPRFVFVEGDALRAEAFCTELHDALTRFSERCPRGNLDPGLLTEMARYRATIEAIGSYWSGPSHAIGFDPSPRALVLPPAARIVHVVPTESQNVRALMDPWIRYVASVGAESENGLAKKIRAWIPGARWSRLGWMQRPLLDGPVDMRGLIREGPANQ